MHYDLQNDQVPESGVTVAGTTGRNHTVLNSVRNDEGNQVIFVV